MRTLLSSSVLVSALAVASPATAKDLSVSVTLDSYNGPAAYVAAYIVDGKGNYVSTIYAAGSRDKYLRHLARWYRMVARSGNGIDGSTGASIGSGGSLNTSVTIPDKMIDAGYQVIVETAVEEQANIPVDASIALDSANNGKSVKGTGYVNSLSVKF
jgi:hypothetical protein